MEPQNQCANAETNNTAADVIGFSSDVKHCISACASSCCSLSHHQVYRFIRICTLLMQIHWLQFAFFLPVKWVPKLPTLALKHLKQQSFHIRRHTECQYSCSMNSSTNTYSRKTFALHSVCCIYGGHYFELTEQSNVYEEHLNVLLLVMKYKHLYQHISCKKWLPLHRLLTVANC
jgi:hypothetical protein